MCDQRLKGIIKKKSYVVDKDGFEFNNRYDEYLYEFLGFIYFFSIK